MKKKLITSTVISNFGIKKIFEFIKNFFEKKQLFVATHLTNLP